MFSFCSYCQSRPRAGGDPMLTKRPQRWTELRAGNLIPLGRGPVRLTIRHREFGSRALPNN
jgi:hypothetical protein